MSTVELKNRLIEKIQNSDNNTLLEDVYRLFELENQSLEIYELNESQLDAVNEAREQIKTGKYLTSDQAEKEIDEWLGK
jgi:hypothetical protein